MKVNFFYFKFIIIYLILLKKSARNENNASYMYLLHVYKQYTTTEFKNTQIWQICKNIIYVTNYFPKYFIWKNMFLFCCNCVLIAYYEKKNTICWQTKNYEIKGLQLSLWNNNSFNLMTILKMKMYRLLDFHHVVHSTVSRRMSDSHSGSQS